MKKCANCKYHELNTDEEPCKSCNYIDDDEMSLWEAIPPEYDPAEVAFSKVQDSGERKEFSTGAKRDIQEGKGRCDLLPLHEVAVMMGDGTTPDFILEGIYMFVNSRNHGRRYLASALEGFAMERGWDLPTMFLELAAHFEEGAKKYGEYNWQKGIPIHSYIDSAVRHYLKYRRGDTDERHDRAFCWNIVCCIWTIANKPKMCDIRGEINDNDELQ